MRLKSAVEKVQLFSEHAGKHSSSELAIDQQLLLHADVSHGALPVPIYRATR